jgi:effector-binding domain-containing protein
MKRVLLSVGVALSGLLLALGPAPVIAQGSGVSRPAPVETTPLPPPGEMPQAAPPASSRSPETPTPSGGGIMLTEEPPPGAPRGAQGQAATPEAPAAARPTLVPSSGDPLDVTEVTLPGKPAAILAGSSSWDESFGNLKSAVAKIEDELAKAGVRPTGRPLAVFVETDDMGFRYEAMVPVEAVPEGRSSLTPEIRFGNTPEGSAYHFVHRGPYDEIDSTYETITAYLDSKGILAKEAFIEEYVTDLTESADENLEINIFVQPR